MLAACGKVNSAERPERLDDREPRPRGQEINLKKKSRKTTQQQKIKKNFEDQITADIVIKVRGVRNSCTGLLFTSPHGRGAPM